MPTAPTATPTVVVSAERSVVAVTDAWVARRISALLPISARVVLESFNTATAALTPSMPPAPAVLSTREPSVSTLSEEAATVRLPVPTLSLFASRTDVAPTLASVVLLVIPTPTAPPMPTNPPAAPAAVRSSWVLSVAVTSMSRPAVTRVSSPISAWVLSCEPAAVEFMSEATASPDERDVSVVLAALRLPES